MRILILGGDGFCGWPTALHLSACGHDVAIVDNLARRNADVELVHARAQEDAFVAGVIAQTTAR